MDGNTYHLSYTGQPFRYARAVSQGFKCDDDNPVPS